LHELDVDLAARAFRQLGNAGMVQSLLEIAHVEEIHLLAGHVLLLLGEDFDAAQERFLKSSRPIAALEMRRDLRQWDKVGASLRSGILICLMWVVNLSLIWGLNLLDMGS
jgi:WD repeat-containing protein 19